MGLRPLALVLLAALAGCGGGARELLPDLEQAVPYAISIEQIPGRRLLVFASAVDNVGEGPVLLEGSRRTARESEMRARQIIVMSDGTRRAIGVVATIRYARSETHEHWHLVGFERYELRTTEGRLVRPGRKTGFCLGDRYETSAADLPGEPPEPVLTRECGRFGSGLLAIEQGISVGYGDDYVPELEGQWIDVTGLRPGRYVLVHRANRDRSLREAGYANNLASVLVEIRPRQVRILARCPNAGTCSDRQA